ncbi:hypothetical protein N7519_011698 [Penicillium mononematosum]|uniref:uncharacterized protein n=1 Tax=Penicillium mononematosum TaxID=268346 RepID=UPI0025489F0F|nr:uncharacterized protein N7519_011698 [Penicillium mononematosum]KAJ6181237.1 hypothetical protein N7519_011698 [Penicillium mononematosum]
MKENIDLALRTARAPPIAEDEAVANTDSDTDSDSEWEETPGNLFIEVPNYTPLPIAEAEVRLQSLQQFVARPPELHGFFCPIDGCDET